jgi:hypothetical protein
MALMALVLLCLLTFRCLCYIWRGRDAASSTAQRVGKRSQLPFAAHRLLLFGVACQGLLLLLLLWGLAFRSLQEVETSPWLGGGGLLAAWGVGWLYAWRRGALTWK